jgi:ATP-dependent RNA helicase RhlE
VFVLIDVQEKIIKEQLGFDSLGLSEPLLRAVKEAGYLIPSPIQEKSIPSVLEGRDVMGAAQTGTGKTAAFGLPILENLLKKSDQNNNSIQVLILSPTRELAAQISESINLYAKHTELSCAVVFGGVNINPQIKRLKKPLDILVATPGRLLDLHRQRALNLKDISVLVLDEADRMLDMGFIHDIRRILRLIPNERQSLLFSATFSDEIKKLAQTVVKNPVLVSVAASNSTAEKVEQRVFPVEKNLKSDLLVSLIRQCEWDQVLVFCRTKHGADKLSRVLQQRKINSAAIHGNKSQGARTKALQDFKDKKITVLVATDIASRGIDIDKLPQVVNYDLPFVPEDYVHRIGRTGRAGEAGHAISLVSQDESKELFGIERLIKKTIQREWLDGYDRAYDIVSRSSGPRDNKFFQKKSFRPSNGYSDQARPAQAPRRFFSRPSSGRGS